MNTKYSITEDGILCECIGKRRIIACIEKNGVIKSTIGRRMTQAPKGYFLYWCLIVILTGYLCIMSYQYIKYMSLYQNNVEQLDRNYAEINKKLQCKKICADNLVQQENLLIQALYGEFNWSTCSNCFALRNEVWAYEHTISNYNECIGQK